MNVKHAKLANKYLNEHINILCDNIIDGIKPAWKDVYIQNILKLRELSYEIERSLCDE